jgi:predicted NUDIX family phosphoesterase
VGCAALTHPTKLIRGKTVSHPSSERVLVVPGSELDRLGRFQGFQPEAERYLRALLVPELMQYLPRSEVEDDPSLKQIIPYVVLRCGDAVFCYKRGTSQGEARLHSLRSLGVGGHVAESDADGLRGYSAYDRAVKRELDEEVAIESPGRMRLIGLINDDSTPVGSVHLGVVHLLELERPSVRPREDGIAEPEFVSLSDLDQIAGEFETWSQICIGAFLRAR